MGNKKISDFVFLVIFKWGHHIRLIDDIAPKYQGWFC
jgi:hypothetical protein